MALDWQRPARRFRVYIQPPAGGRLLWDDADTKPEAELLGESTLCPWQIYDTHSSELPWRVLK